ncbi:MAG TPA: IclR family transcriptional regulator [Candidatus Pseudogracilibacillus intestinigallinarum]|uniref:IclR family transcriptional regulator n=1 Tax=Candidatus Pseudogracilibacillus intestinigallinarum TaxID=2838742 RepID=A0A9D1PK93_9BACI|nr:IclR family transcriptional regulator [Candidatus Pseudogracilibacillus intestinigallinarum]
MTEPKRQNTVAVLEKALEVISFLETTKDGIGLTEIAQQTNINKTTVYRILQTLMLDNIVVYGELKGTYKLGYRLLELGEIVQNNIDIRTIALPHLKQLTKDTDHTTYLSILHNDASLCVERIDGLNVQVLLLNVGDVWPLYVGGVARAMLSFLDDEKIEKIIQEENQQEVTLHSDIIHNDYWEMIHQTREKGYSTSFEDVVKGVSSIGAPIFNHRGEVVAAVSLSTTSILLPPSKEEEIAFQVVDTANKISKHLGWNGNRPY